MLNQETEDRLKVLGIDVSKLTDAVKAEEEKSLDVPTLYTEEQKNSFGKNRFDEGKNAMSEIIAKDVRKTFKIETDSKDINEVVKLYGETKVKELGNPNEKITALEAEKEELQGKISALSTENTQIQSDFENKLFQTAVNSEINGLIPENTTIEKSDVATLFLNSYSITKDDNGNKVVSKNGEVLKDNLLNPLGVNQVLNSFLDEKGLVSQSGMGGKNRTSGGSAKFSNIAEFQAYCKSNDIEPMGTEGQALLAKNKSDNFSY